MKIMLWSVGKGHENYVEDGIKEFTKRISRYYPVEWNIIPPPRNAGAMAENELKLKEGENILQLLKQEDYLVALDERGKIMDSPGLARFIEARASESKKNLVFLIGGAYGIDKKVLDRANFTLSLSSFTFPHQLVRLILCEQVYRACSILRNEKYHHS